MTDRLAGIEARLMTDAAFERTARDDMAWLVEQVRRLERQQKHGFNCDLAPYLLGIADVRCTCGTLDHVSFSAAGNAGEVSRQQRPIAQPVAGGESL